jgi:hypothetical protein
MYSRAIFKQPDVALASIWHQLDTVSRVVPNVLAKLEDMLGHRRFDLTQFRTRRLPVFNGCSWSGQIDLHACDSLFTEVSRRMLPKRDASPSRSYM